MEISKNGSLNSMAINYFSNTKAVEESYRIINYELKPEYEKIQATEAGLRRSEKLLVISNAIKIQEEIIANAEMQLTTDKKDIKSVLTEGEYQPNERINIPYKKSSIVEIWRNEEDGISVDGPIDVSLLNLDLTDLL